MKTNVLVKFAVVATAAFGAYAFSGSANQQQLFTRSDTCENISVPCSDTGDYACRIELKNKAVVAILDTDCMNVIRHSEDRVFQWN